MTDPLQQAIERNRGKDPRGDEKYPLKPVPEFKFREALAIADAALERIIRITHPIGNDVRASAQEARSEMRKLFEEAPHG